MVGDGDESDPSVKWRGRSVDVAEAFEFPFESPPGGCLLRYNFLVQDGYELGFSLRWLRHVGGLTAHFEVRVWPCNGRTGRASHTAWLWLR